MNKFCRINKLLLIPMAILLPFWLTIGRSMLGSSGFMTVGYIFTVAPILIFTLFLFDFLLTTRKDIKTTGRLGIIDSILLTILYISIFFHGFFLVDGVVDGSSRRESSVFTNLLNKGSNFETTSLLIANSLFSISEFLLIILLILFIYERKKNSSLFNK